MRFSLRPRLCLTAALFGGMALGGGSLVASPVPAYADTASDLAAAQSELEAIGTEYEQLKRELRQAGMDLETTKGEIDEKTQELSSAQAALSANAVSDYKSGGASLADVVLGATDFDDLISRLFYMNKVTDAQARAIANVKQLKSDLEKKEREQEQRLSDTQEKVDQQAANQQQAQALVNSLSADVKAQLESEAQTNEAVAAGLQSSEDASSNPVSSGSITGDTGGGSSGGGTQTGGGTSSGEQTGGGTVSGGNASGGGVSGGGSSSLPQNPTGGSPLAVALQYAGAPYVYGGSSPSAGGFDCSGLVQWSYAQCGVYLPRTDAAQRSYIQSNGFYTTDVNQLSYGDLVFFPGHVAFYMGNGQIYGAQSPGYGAGTSNMIYFGTFLGGGHL